MMRRYGTAVQRESFHRTKPPCCLCLFWSGRNGFLLCTEERENSGTTEKMTTDELRQLLETEALQMVLSNQGLDTTTLAQGIWRGDLSNLCMLRAKKTCQILRALKMNHQRGLCRTLKASTSLNLSICPVPVPDGRTAIATGVNRESTSANAHIHAPSPTFSSLPLP